MPSGATTTSQIKRQPEPGKHCSAYACWGLLCPCEGVSSEKGTWRIPSTFYFSEARLAREGEASSKGSPKELPTFNHDPEVSSGTSSCCHQLRMTRETDSLRVCPLIGNMAWIRYHPACCVAVPCRCVSTRRFLGTRVPTPPRAVLRE